ncbi:spore germination protein [Siminovitchia sediminis]|uniref:Spore germination protein n=1 Tax=Siminovitchia sediminis TaxID=1274353 RepID=A0ABW4KNC8_9BACI
MDIRFFTAIVALFCCFFRTFSGMILVFIMMSIHMVNLKSLGIPYSTPFTPTMSGDWKDLIIRAPMSMLTKRPKFLDPEDSKSVNKEVKDS